PASTSLPRRRVRCTQSQQTGGGRARDISPARAQYKGRRPHPADHRRSQKQTKLRQARHLTERIYRDSVHNIIRVNTDSAEGRLIVSLIDTPEFQRLRRIRQLGLAYFAYQAAEHSRFTHSLGAFHLAARMIAKLRLDYEISDEAPTAARDPALI